MPFQNPHEEGSRALSKPRINASFPLPLPVGRVAWGCCLPDTATFALTLCMSGRSRVSPSVAAAGMEPGVAWRDRERERHDGARQRGRKWNAIRARQRSRKEGLRTAPGSAVAGGRRSALTARRAQCSRVIGPGRAVQRTWGPPHNQALTLLSPTGAAGVFSR